MRGDGLDGYLSVLVLGDRAGGACLRRGQFHDVVLAGEVAYRFPRDEESRRTLPARVALLDALAAAAPACGLPAALIPGPLAGPDMSQPVGRCHAALRRLPGRQLSRDEAGSQDVLAELARLLDALASLSQQPAVAAAVPAADPRYWERFADDVGRVLFPLMPDPGRQRAAAELAAVKTVDPAGDALVHGDLGGSNLLWTGTASGFRLTGILDWDEAHIGSQADDLASLATMLGWPAAERLDRQRHGGRARTVADARIIETTFALQQALPAALSGDAESLADGLTRYTVD
ncbi:MAG TPA: aminoglycoside phosphotransferase family protein [Streptosporangiaceae bacterium]|jgi:Ser/Thr protein kinase RdoA (MazF antagonist)